MGAISVIFLLLLLLCPVFMALVYSKNTHTFFSLSKARPSGLRAKMCLCLYRQNRWCRQCGILRCLFEVWPYSGPLLVGGSHAVPCNPESCIDPIPQELLGSGLRENANGVPSPKHRLVEDFRIENVNSLHIPWCMAIRGSCRTGR